MNIYNTASLRACTIPKFGAFFYHKGAKWISIQILPPLYILGVNPSNDGISISIGANGYVGGILLNIIYSLQIENQIHNVLNYVQPNIYLSNYNIIYIILCTFFISWFQFNPIIIFTFIIFYIIN